VKYAAGDILSFRFRYFPVPDNNGALDGMQGYLTEFIPPNTQVVGVRILSSDSSGAVVIPPRYPGMSVDAGGTGSSISEVYADTGIFYTGDSRLVRSPVADFLLLNNGVPITEPSQASNIAAIVGANPQDIRAHNTWDAAQANAFGSGGLTPSGRGSPVAAAAPSIPTTRATSRSLAAHQVQRLADRRRDDRQPGRAAPHGGRRLGQRLRSHAPEPHLRPRRAAARCASPSATSASGGRALPRSRCGSSTRRSSRRAA
jgi:hypothetical protein